VKYVRDTTGRFKRRPHFEPYELDRECEKILFEFLLQRFGEFRFPVPTDALEVLIEQHAEDLDMYADLSGLGADVEGVTEFISGSRPRVQISKRLSEDVRLENRLRTTLTHEFGHVKFHAPLWELDDGMQDLFGVRPERMSISCKRENIITASEYDWMEWQAGYVCGAMLMPRSRVKELAKQFLSKSSAASLAVTAPSAIDLIGRVMETFHVSSDAARVRLIKLRVLAEQRNSDLFALGR